MPIDYSKNFKMEKISRVPEQPEIKKDDRATGIMPLEADYPSKVESNAVHLPKTAKRNYGCMHCEWKKFGICPHGFKVGKGFEFKKNLHVAGICQERINYLLSFSTGYDKKPSYALWRRDFNAGMADIKVKEDWFKLHQVEDKLLSLENDGGKAKDIKALDSKRKSLRKEWQSLWKELIQIDDRQIDRDTPKKLEVENKDTIPLSKIHSIMRGDTVDAEFKVETEKEEKEEKEGKEQKEKDGNKLQPVREQE